MNSRTAEAPKRRPSRPSEPTPWQRRTYGFGRYAIIAIPAFALIAGLLPRSSAAFSIDPTVYAHYLATGQWRRREVLATFGLAVTGVLSIVGLASLLFRGRARGFAFAGLVAGLVGSAGLLASVGSVVIREDRLRHAFVDGHRQLAFNADTVGAGSAFLVIGGAFLLTLGWILLGVAVIRTSGMNRADGPLLILSTPLIFLGGIVLHVLPTMGSFLLLAVGLGIVVTAGRISVIGEDTWRQRRRRTALASTASPAAPTSAAPADAGVPLDRAPGLAGALGLARPQLFPESRIASAAIYHAPLASAAEASESTDSPAVVPSTPEPVASNGGVPSDAAAPNATPPSTPAPHAETSNAAPPTAAPANDGAPSNGTATSDAPAGSNGAAPSNGTPPSNGTAPSNGPGVPSTTSAGNGNAGKGKPAGNDRAPTAKSLRDLLRGARGAAAAWPVYRSRSSGPNSGNASRENSGQPNNRSADDRRDATTGRTGTTGRTDTNGRTGRNRRSGTDGRAGGRPDSRRTKGANSSSAAGRSAADPTPQPPPPSAVDKPDPSTGSPPARE